jgi:uncharacterized protein (DUF4415 family)
MSESNMRQASLNDIRKMKDKGELYNSSDVQNDELLPPNFWADATLVKLKQPRSVHLKVDADVFDYFKSQGKGHLTKMQDVLRAYMRAHHT